MQIFEISFFIPFQVLETSLVGLALVIVSPRSQWCIWQSGGTFLFTLWNVLQLPGQGQRWPDYLTAAGAFGLVMIITFSCACWIPKRKEALGAIPTIQLLLNLSTSVADIQSQGHTWKGRLLSGRLPAHPKDYSILPWNLSWSLKARGWKSWVPGPPLPSNISPFI